MNGRTCARDREHGTKTFNQDKGHGRDVDREGDGTIGGKERWSRS
jgi:hypothetical protein